MDVGEVLRAEFDGISKNLMAMNCCYIALFSWKGTLEKESIHYKSVDLMAAESHACMDWGVEEGYHLH